MTMFSLSSKPLEQSLSERWNNIDPAYRKAFFAVMMVNLLAFGFEMTNLTLHHDDVYQFFIRDTILGHYLGRFGMGWLHYYTQNAHIMPFLQMAEGIVLMSAYGLLVAHLWGMRKTLDIVIVASVLCVFPYMAQVYQYNSTMATYSVAHFLSALAVLLSVAATFRGVVLATLAYIAAFSIYQSVIANAAAIFCIWILCQLLFNRESVSLFSRAMTRSGLAVLLAVIAGGLIYVGIVSQLNIPFDASQDAAEAFSLKRWLDLSLAVPEVLRGTRSFFFWPEHYFPNYLKKLQLVFLAAAVLFCAWLPKGATNKIGALLILALTLFTPRLLQFIHPKGEFHNLTLTAYAVVVAGSLMILLRSGPLLTRNLSSLLSALLIGGYLIQCNWISTVSHLNTLAHYSTMTQILTRLWSLPAESWDGRTVAVVGNLKMSTDYPFLRTTGVAAEFIDASHLEDFAHLLRDDLVIVDMDNAPPAAREYAARHGPWPRPDSIGAADGMAVLVLSKAKGGPVHE
jgi:hypothetical protein